MMSILNTVAPEQAEGAVAELYNAFEKQVGFIPNAFRLNSVSPKMMQQQWEYIGYYIEHPSLSKLLTTLIRLLVSERADCAYCVNLNTALLINEAGLSAEEVAAIKADPAKAPLDEKEKALLMFVLDAVADPHAMSAAQVQALRDQGCSELEIHDALNHGARQIGVDIMLNTFKVENDF